MAYLYAFTQRVPTKTELHECEKLLLTPDSSDCITQCQSYECNERSMLDFEGSMSEPSWRSKNQFVFEDDCNDVTDLASTIV